MRFPSIRTRRAASRILLATLAAGTLAFAAAQGVEPAQDAAPEAEADATTPAAPTGTPEEAMRRVADALSGDATAMPAGTLVEDLRNLRLVLEATGDEALRVVAVAIEPVEEAFATEPFDRARLVAALQELALTLRIAAEPGDASLAVELASLVDGTAAAIQDDEGYEPRLEVDTP